MGNGNMTQADWHREFADAMETFGQGWHCHYETYWLTDDTWQTPEDAHELFAMACNAPLGIRCKPGRVQISGPGGTFSYSEPMQKRPEGNKTYYAPSYGLAYASQTTWIGSSIDYTLLKRGRCHETYAAAKEHAEAEIRAAGYMP